MRNLIPLALLLINLIPIQVYASPISESTKQFETKVLSHIDLMKTHTENILMHRAKHKKMTSSKIGNRLIRII